jgi:arsenate reductase
VVGHWGSPDPAAVEGTEEAKYRAFVAVASEIARRVELFCAFSDEQLAAFRAADLTAIAREGRPAGGEAAAP